MKSVSKAAQANAARTQPFTTNKNKVNKGLSHTSVTADTSSFSFPSLFPFTSLSDSPSPPYQSLFHFHLPDPRPLPLPLSLSILLSISSLPARTDPCHSLVRDRVCFPCLPCSLSCASSPSLDQVFPPATSPGKPPQPCCP